MVGTIYNLAQFSIVRDTCVAMVSLLRSCKCLVNVDIMHYFGIDSKAVELLVKNSSHLRRMKVEGSKLWCCKNLGVK